MYKNTTSIEIDSEKFMKWYFATKKEHKLSSAREFAAKIGYGEQLIPNIRNRCVISPPICKLLELTYGLKLEDVLPDKPDKKKPEPQEAEKPEPVDLSGLKTMLKNTLHAVTEIQGTTDDMKKGFRVQTNPRLDTESISEGVYSGLCRFWERNKKEIIGQLRGLVFAGTFDAGKKLDEMQNQNALHIAQ